MNGLPFNSYPFAYDRRRPNGRRLYSLCADLEEDIEHNRHSEGNAGNADDEPGGYFLYSKDIPEQIRCGIRHTRLFKEVAGGRNKHPKAYDASHAIKRAQMLPGCSESAQSCDVDGISSRFGVELFPQSVVLLIIWHIVVRIIWHTIVPDGLRRPRKGVSGRKYAEPTHTFSPRFAVVMPNSEHRSVPHN
jgi:hypothetical protein